MAEQVKETRVVNDVWDLTTYSWRVEADGMKLLVDGLKEGKILGRKGESCNTGYVPGPRYCRKCFVDIDEVVEVEKTGRIVTFAINLADIRGNPLDEPVISIVAKLDGSDSLYPGILEGIDWQEVEAGMAVKLALREELTGQLADITGYVPA